MDPLKLLTRATGLNAKDIRASHAATQESTSTQPLTTTTVTPNLGKRKREELETVSADEPRTVLKRNKIKVIDLGALRRARESGKIVQKDHYRIYPSPVTSFHQLQDRFDVRSHITQNLIDQGYVEPTQVQMAALPFLLDPEPLPNLLTVAPTGSGKTVAFMVPLINNIAHRGNRNSSSTAKESHVSALILAPTKELVNQIVNEGRKLTAKTGVSISGVRKGMRVAGRTRRGEESSEGTEIEGSDADSGHANTAEVKSDILVSTPLALLRAIGSSEEKLTSALPNVQYLVLDEADVLLDELFRRQTLSAWKACTNPELQTSLWSATMGSNIEEVALNTVNEHRKSTSQSKRQLLRCVVGLKDSAVSTVTHRLVFAGTEQGKLLGLRQILRPPPGLAVGRPQPLRFPFLVYTQTIERATALHNELLHEFPSDAGGTERVAVLHSGLSDTKRANVMTRFRAGEIWILFTTDLLSRGIDFRGVNGIVNYDIPTTTAAYVHRAGRSGRAGRGGGVAVTLFTKEDFKYLRGIANVIAASEKAKGGRWEDVEGLQKWMFEVLPNVSKKDKKELKQRGVQSRRAAREGDDEKAIKAKRKARIGTQSGYQIQKDKNRKGAIEASKRKAREGGGGSDENDWSGF